MDWVWGTRLEYILSVAASMFYVIFFRMWHRKEFSDFIMYLHIVIHLAVLSAIFVTKPVFFQALFFNVFYIAIPTFIYFIYVIIKSIRNNNVSAKVNLVGILIIFVAFLNDFFIGQGWYQSWNLVLPAVALYIIINVVSMSRQFAQSIFKIESQNVQLRKLNESNETLTVKLQNEIKRKDEFLANTSHELRNPLHGIINIAHSILINKSEKLDKEMKDEINLQVTIGHHMAQTLDDLLDITRLKEQQIALKKSYVQLDAIAKAVIDILEVLIERKNVTFELDIDEKLPPVVADEDRLIQIFFNLLHNALKFTYEGKIIVRAYARDNDVVIEVEDTGIGIEEELLSRLFNPYEQVDLEPTTSSGGIGLGLSICKQLIELHGGTIKATSTLKEGSMFTFTLPIITDEICKKEDAKEIVVVDYEKIQTDFSTGYQQMLATIVENSEPKDKAGILIVDDDTVNTRVIHTVLSESNYDIFTATNGFDALAILEKENIDLVIADVMMPQMSGYKLTKKIREKHSISELPIILLTARNKSDDIYTGFLSGANDYLIKPVDAMELLVRVDALTKLQTSIKERLRMEAAWLHAQIKPHFLLNTLNSIVSLSQFDLERMTKLIGHFANYLNSTFQFKNIDKIVLLEDEIKLLESYLYIQQVRFGDRLDVRWEIDDIEEVALPPLAIQTIVENAVNHGILARDDGGTVTIQVKNVEAGVKIAVKDNGVGMKEEVLEQLLIAHPDHKRGIGLINTEKRLQRLFGTGLHITSEVGVGTTVSFIVAKKQN